MKCHDFKLIHLMVYMKYRSFKNLNNVKLCTPLDTSTLNYNHKINSIHFILNKNTKFKNYLVFFFFFFSIQ
jgi:hypothetical protein